MVCRAQKNHLGGEIWYRSLEHSTKRRQNLAENLVPIPDFDRCNSYGIKIFISSVKIKSWKQRTIEFDRISSRIQI